MVAPAGLIVESGRLVRNGEHHGCRCNPSGLPFIWAASCCLSSSVKYVRHRSFGVTGSTPACLAMVHTRSITAWSVMAFVWMRPPLTGHSRAPDQSPRIAI